jgi:hypothetical protein
VRVGRAIECLVWITEALASPEQIGCSRLKSTRSSQHHVEACTWWEAERQLLGEDRPIVDARSCDTECDCLAPIVEATARFAGTRKRTLMAEVLTASVP